jgi:Bacterial Ig-like domain
MMIIQDVALQAAPKIAQTTVLGILIASTLIVIGLLGLIGIFAWKTERSLEYGSFFVVVLGILTSLIGFLVAFPLLVSGVFDDPTQVLALLSALFGTIVGLVGTYFGIKTSSDARQDAQTLAKDALASDTTPPTVSSVSPLPNATGVPPDARVTATFSKDMDPATITTNTFKLVEEATHTPVAGSIVYDSPTKGATFRPRKDLANNTTYQVTITTDVKDKVGNTMAQEDTWKFTVAP